MKNGGLLQQGGMTSKVLGGKVCLPSLGTSEPTVRTPDWSRPMGLYPSLEGLIYPYVCYVCLRVSDFSPRRGSRRRLR